MSVETSTFSGRVGRSAAAGDLARTFQHCWVGGWGQNTGLLSVSECVHSPPGISETHTYSVPSMRLNLRNCSGRGGWREQGLSTPCSRAKV